MVSPVELPDGRVLGLHLPQVVAFNLVGAQRHAERGRKLRSKIIGNLIKTNDGSWRVKDPRKGLDCVQDLASAVLFAYTALEGLGNHTIDQIDDDAAVETERDGEIVTVSKARMERALSVSEKLTLVVPLFTGKPPLKGDALWGEFVKLRRLRDGLVHPKNRGSNPITGSAPDPKDPGIYGLLMRGDADSSADNAIALVQRLRPEFMPEHVLSALRP